MGPTGRYFLKAICICLLSPRAKSAQEPEKSDVAALSIAKNPDSRNPLCRLENSSKKAKKASKNILDKTSNQQKANPAAEPVIPKFFQLAL